MSKNGGERGLASKIVFVFHAANGFSSALFSNKAAETGCFLRIDLLLNLVFGSEQTYFYPITSSQNMCYTALCQEHIFPSTHHTPGQNADTFDSKEGTIAPKSPSTNHFTLAKERGRLIWKGRLVGK